MVHVVQTVEATPRARPFTSKGERPSWAPKAQIIFAEAAQVVDLIGVGDTGGFVLQFPLPTNAIYVLQRLMISHRGADTFGWDSPSFAMWFGLTGDEVGEAIEIRMPMCNTRFIPPATVANQEAYYTYGGGDRAYQSSSASTAQVQKAFVDTLILPGGYPAANSPQFGMVNPDASQVATEVDYVCIFNQYEVNASLEAMFNSNNPMGQPG